MSVRTCYMCEEEATSDEHAPPKCLFPERKDVPNGIDYRKNLITVPSCEKHNSSKSHDDEYLLHVLSGSYTSSHVGLTQFITKVRRAFEKAPSKAASFIQRHEPILLKRHTEDEWEQGAQVSVKGERIDLVLGNCARALYFYETAQKFIGPVRVITAFTMYLNAELQADITSKVDSAKAYFSSHLPKGENPDVFWYKFEESENTAIFFMCFYSGSEVLISLNKREQDA